MKLLYLTTHAIKSPILAFTAELAGLTDSSVTLLVGTKTLEGVEKIEANIKKIAEALINNPFEIKVEVGDPFSLICKEFETEDYDMVIMGIRPRRRMIPSGFRHLSQKIINVSQKPDYKKDKIVLKGKVKKKKRKLSLSLDKITNCFCSGKSKKKALVLWLTKN